MTIELNPDQLKMIEKLVLRQMRLAGENINALDDSRYADEYRNIVRGHYNQIIQMGGGIIERIEIATISPKKSES